MQTKDCLHLNDQISLLTIDHVVKIIKMTNGIRFRFAINYNLKGPIPYYA